MTKNNLKRYLLLSNGNQIDQKYTTLEDSDFVQKGNKLYIKYQDTILDGTKGAKYYGINQVIYTCETEKALKKHMKELFADGEIYFDALKECIASINANCEYHMQDIQKLYEVNAPEKDFRQDANYKFYEAQHYAMEQLKHNMAWQLVWRNNNIEYFGQGGNLPEKHWYDTPLGLHKDKIYW